MISTDSDEHEQVVYEAVRQQESEEVPEVLRACSEYFTLSECNDMERHVYHLTLPARVYIDTTPSERNPHALPVHIRNLCAILVDFRNLQNQFSNPVMFQRISIDLQNILDTLDRLQHHLQALVDGAPTPLGQIWEDVPGGGRRLVLDIDLLRELAEEGMEDKDIALFLNCSIRTLARRKKECGIIKRSYATLSFDDLVEYVIQVRRLGSGHEGLQGVQSGLKELGLRVRRDDVRAALQSLQVAEQETARLPPVRRIYRVPWINSLWHIDGHHKLIRWKFVIHGGIDGFSRMITFLRVSDNNRAETVCEAFLKAVDDYGWPSRVRADHGRENWDVMKTMEDVRGRDRGSFIQGKSTHNQRIERLWVDVQRWCTAKYHQVFTHLEEYGYLNIDNPFHIWVLHFCYLPMIDRSLDFMARRWNRHSLRTERHNSPRLIWMKNRQQAASLGIDPLENPLAFREEDDLMIRHDKISFKEYGVEDGRRFNTHLSEDDPYVEVPPLLYSVPNDIGTWLESSEVQDRLCAIAGPWWPVPKDHGVSRYVQVRRVLEAMIMETYPGVLS